MSQSEQSPAPEPDDIITTIFTTAELDEIENIILYPKIPQPKLKIGEIINGVIPITISNFAELLKVQRKKDSSFNLSKSQP